jgi:hypothetical protein
MQSLPLEFVKTVFCLVIAIPRAIDHIHKGKGLGEFVLGDESVGVSPVSTDDFVWEDAVVRIVGAGLDAEAVGVVAGLGAVQGFVCAVVPVAWPKHVRDALRGEDTVAVAGEALGSEDVDVLCQVFGGRV